MVFEITVLKYKCFRIARYDQITFPLYSLLHISLKDYKSGWKWISFCNLKLLLGITPNKMLKVKLKKKKH